MNNLDTKSSDLFQGQEKVFYSNSFHDSIISVERALLLLQFKGMDLVVNVATCRSCICCLPDGWDTADCDTSGPPSHPSSPVTPVSMGEYSSKKKAFLQEKC